MSEINKFKAFQQNLTQFIGTITEVTFCAKQTGTIYCTFGIPLKKKKEDDPLWLNCIVFGDLAGEFESDCSKGTRVLVGGHLKETVKDGHTYVNFTVQIYEKLSTYVPTEQQQTSLLQQRQCSNEFYTRAFAFYQILATSLLNKHTFKKEVLRQSPSRLSFFLKILCRLLYGNKVVIHY